MCPDKESIDRNEWCTPENVLGFVREVLGRIDLDPASSAIAQERVKADVYYTKDENGLAHTWMGNVFLNPPYSMPLISQFAMKAIREYQAGRINEMIMLVNNATDTAWLTILAMRYPVMFSRGRIKFYHPDVPGKCPGPRQGQAFFYFGAQMFKFYRVFEEIAYRPF